MTYLIKNVVQINEDSNLSVINMLTGIDESKVLTKHISCKCKCKFDGRKCNSDQWWSNDKFLCECKKRHVCEKYYIWNPGTCNCENGKYLASIMDDLAIRCDDDIESYEEEEKTIPTSFNEKKTTYKSQNFYISLAFSLVTIALLIAVSIYCYLIQYRIKQKYLLPFYNRNSELKQILSW